MFGWQFGVCIVWCSGDPGPCSVFRPCSTDFFLRDGMVLTEWPYIQLHVSRRPSPPTCDPVPPWRIISRLMEFVCLDQIY